MEKLYTSKTCLKMAGRMHTPHPTPLDSPLAISYRNHLKSMAYFSHLAPLVLLFFTNKQSQKGGGCIAQLHPLNTLVASVGRSFAFYLDNSIWTTMTPSAPPFSACLPMLALIDVHN